MGLLKARNFALNNNALTRRESKSASDAVDFAETTFDASVDERMALRKRFEVGNVALRVVVENNTRIEYVVRVEELFHFFHELERLFAPFAFDERSHVATSAMFGFERAVVVVYNEKGYVVHKSFVAIDFVLSIKALIDDEVIVTFEGMTIDDSIVVVVMLKELLELFGCFHKMMNRECNVFDETGCAYGAHTAD